MRNEMNDEARHLTYSILSRSCERTADLCRRNESYMTVPVMIRTPANPAVPDPATDTMSGIGLYPLHYSVLLLLLLYYCYVVGNRRINTEYRVVKRFDS